MYDDWKLATPPEYTESEHGPECTCRECYSQDDEPEDDPEGAKPMKGTIHECAAIAASWHGKKAELRGDRNVAASHECAKESRWDEWENCRETACHHYSTASDFYSIAAEVAS